MAPNNKLTETLSSPVNKNCILKSNEITENQDWLYIDNMKNSNTEIEDLKKIFLVCYQKKFFDSLTESMPIPNTQPKRQGWD